MNHYVMTAAEQKANAFFVMFAVWGSIIMTLTMLALLGLSLREKRPDTKADEPPIK